MEAMAQAPQDDKTVEVTEKAKRRQYSAAYKLKILALAEGCTKSGELGALLRREGLYSSHLAAWRKARVVGEHAGLEPKQRGPKVKVDASAEKFAEQEKELARWKARAERAELLVEIQKKVATLLGIELPENGGKR